MRSISVNRRQRRVVLGAAATAVLLAATLLSSPRSAGHGERRGHNGARAIRVNISEFAFHPRTLRVRRGARIVFLNSDSTAHTATRRGGFDTGHILPGHSVAVRMRRAGVYSYRCTIHPFMRGKIVVR
jgi:plastocyanin